MRVGATLSYGWFAVKGEIDAAETLFEEVRATATELGVEPFDHRRTREALVDRLRGDYKKAEKLLREALRMTSVRGDRGILPNLQHESSIILADGGKVEAGAPREGGAGEHAPWRPRERHRACSRSARFARP